MKKLLVLLLLFAAVISLSACTKEETFKIQVEEDWLPYYEMVREKVMVDYPDANIEFIVTGSFDHLDALDATDASNSEIADIFAAPADRLYGLEGNDYLAYLPAQEMATNIGGWDDFDAGLGGAFKIDGNYVAMPMNIETLIFFVNEANVADAGLDFTNPVDITDFADDELLVAYFNAWFGVAFTNAVGIELLGKDASGNLYSDMTKDWADLSTEQQALFTHLFDYWKHHNDAETAAWDADNVWGMMETGYANDGKSALVLEGPWNTNKFNEIAENNFDIYPLTSVEIAGQPLAHWKGGWGLVVNARNEGNDENMELAQAFIEEMLNPENAVDFFKYTGKIMENVPAETYANSSLTYSEKLVIRNVLESYEAAPARPLFSEWGNVWGTWENGMLSWNTENAQPTTAEEAYNKVKASFVSMMETLGE